MKYFILALFILLAGCASPKSVPVVVTKTVVLMPPKDFFNCPKVTVPASVGLTDKRVSVLLFSYDKALKTCRVNMQAIQKYLVDNAKEN
jgi:uncharacterized protein YcfL